MYVSTRLYCHTRQSFFLARDNIVFERKNGDHYLFQLDAGFSVDQLCLSLDEQMLFVLLFLRTSRDVANYLLQVPLEKVNDANSVHAAYEKIELPMVCETDFACWISAPTRDDVYLCAFVDNTPMVYKRCGRKWNLLFQSDLCYCAVHEFCVYDQWIVMDVDPDAECHSMVLAVHNFVTHTEYDKTFKYDKHNCRGPMFLRGVMNGIIFCSDFTPQWTLLSVTDGSVLRVIPDRGTGFVVVPIDWTSVGLGRASNYDFDQWEVQPVPLFTKEQMFTHVTHACGESLYKVLIDLIVKYIGFCS